MTDDVEEEVERIDGTRMGFALAEAVLGSREIGLKSINSVLMLSGEDPSSDSELDEELLDGVVAVDEMVIGDSN